MDKIIEIKMSKCKLFLKETELITLLGANPDIWEQALRRGKGILRSRQAAIRNQKGDGKYEG